MGGGRCVCGGEMMEGAVRGSGEGGKEGRERDDHYCPIVGDGYDCSDMTTGRGGGTYQTTPPRSFSPWGNSLPQPHPHPTPLIHLHHPHHLLRGGCRGRLGGLGSSAAPRGCGHRGLG